MDSPVSYGSCAATALLVAIVLAMPARAADERRSDCDGLWELARLATVQRLAANDPGQHPKSEHRPTIARYSRCPDPGAAVSGGFTAALEQFGLRVRWQFERDARYCEQAAPHECRPFWNADFQLSAPQREDLERVWIDVRESLLLLAFPPAGVSRPAPQRSGRLGY